MYNFLQLNLQSTLAENEKNMKAGEFKAINGLIIKDYSQNKNQNQYPNISEARQDLIEDS